MLQHISVTSLEPCLMLPKWSRWVYGKVTLHRNHVHTLRCRRRHCCCQAGVAYEKNLCWGSRCCTSLMVTFCLSHCYKLLDKLCCPCWVCGQTMLQTWAMLLSSGSGSWKTNVVGPGIPIFFKGLWKSVFVSVCLLTKWRILTCGKLSVDELCCRRRLCCCQAQVAYGKVMLWDLALQFSLGAFEKLCCWTRASC